MRRCTLAIAVLVSLGAATTGAQQSAAPKPAPKVSKQEAALRATAKVSEDSARAIALRTVPGATVRASEIEKEKGALIWSFDLRIAGKQGIEEVNVDAMTGKVIAHEHESDATEAKEARAEVRARQPNNSSRKP